MAAGPERDPACVRSSPVSERVVVHVKVLEHSPPWSLTVIVPLQFGMPKHVKLALPPPFGLFGLVPRTVPTTVVSANAVAETNANDAAAMRAALPGCAMFLPVPCGGYSLILRR